MAAYRTNAKSSVGEGLLEAGVISPTTYQDMLAAQKAGKRAPDLFAAFPIDKEALQAALDNILKQVIYAMFEWNEGTFSFVLEDAPDVWRGFALEGARTVAEGGLNPQYLAIEGARLRDERAKEDSLSSFLMKAQPQPQQRPPSALNVQEIAAKLRSAAELDARPHAAEQHGPAPIVPAPSSEKVIPFPAERLRSRPGPGTAAPGAAFAQLAAPVAPADSGAEPVPTAAPSVVSSRPRYRLLAVDDDPQVTKYIQAAFETRFAAITTVDTVKDALSEIEADPEDLVIASDLIIARSDGRGILGGIEILEKVRQRWADLPVILFTDYQNEEAETRAKSMGALSVLLKPRKAQVQAAAKEGGGGVVHEFLKGLGAALTAYFGAPTSSTARVVAAPAVLPPPRAPAAGSGGGRALEMGGGAPATTAGEGGQSTFDLGSAISREMDDLGRTLENEMPPPLIAAGDMAVLRSMLAELIEPSNRDTVTLLVLRFASHHVERAGLFLATRRAYVGLGGFSVDEPSGHFVSRVRRIQVPVDADSIFAKVSHFRSMIRSPLKETEGNRALIKGLGGSWPLGEVVAAPLISSDRVAAILFGDNPSGKGLGATDGLEIFLQQAGLAMDRALLERKLEDTRKNLRGAE